MKFFFGWDDKWGFQCPHALIRFPPPFMYYVFHHFSAHLPRQIWFWKNLIKTWDWVRPPPPSLVRKTMFFEKSKLETPLSFTLFSKMPIVPSTLMCPSMCEPTKMSSPTYHPGTCGRAENDAEEVECEIRAL